MSAPFSHLDHAAGVLSASELQCFTTAVASCRNARAEALLSQSGMAAKVTSRGVLSDSECAALAEQRATEQAEARRAWDEAQPVINVLAVIALAVVAYIVGVA